MVECPCCHGEKTLPVFDALYEVWSKFMCCHCQGQGKVPAEDRAKTAMWQHEEE